MHIKEFLAIDAVEQADGDLDQDVTGLAYDSRKAGAGQIRGDTREEESLGHRQSSPNSDLRGSSTAPACDTALVWVFVRGIGFVG